MKGDRIFAICVFAFALAYLFMDLNVVGLKMGGPVGPRVFPGIIAIGLLVSAMLLFFEARGRSGSVASRPAPTYHALLLAGTALWTAIYYVAFEPLGYIVSTGLYMFPLLMVFNRGMLLTNLLISIAFSFAAFGLFSDLLGVSMPRGIFSF
jgi:putative tricarboxylic transport membrane protein